MHFSTSFDPEPERTFLRRLREARRRDHVVHNPLFEDSEEEGEMSSHNENNRPPPPPPPQQLLKDFSQPSSATAGYGYRPPETEAANFELKPSLITMVERNQFSGNIMEDPNLHIQTFLQYCNTIKHANVTRDYVRRSLFPFSLKDKARTWLNDLNMDTITSWEDLALAFQRKYYPPERTATLRSKITNFSQESDESLYDAWERFKELLRLCPHHGLEKWFLVQSFYNGLGNESRTLLDSAANGRFMNQEVNAAYDLIEEIAVHNSQFGRPRGHARKGGVYVIDDKYESLASQINSISQKLDKLQTTPPPMTVAAMSAQSGATDSFCDLCGSFGHLMQSCSSPHEQICAFQAYKNNPFSNTYNPGYKDHPYFSWRSNNVQNPQQAPSHAPQQQMARFQPSGSSHPPGFSRPQQHNDIHELKNMMVQMQKNMEAMQTHNKHLETQIAQIAQSTAQRQPGHLPSQAAPPPQQSSQNPPRDHVNAITLRSGTAYEALQMPMDDKEEESRAGDTSKVAVEDLEEEQVTSEKAKEKRDIEEPDTTVAGPIKNNS